MFPFRGMSEWVCVYGHSSQEQRRESPIKTNSNGSAQHMDSLWGKSSIPLTAALDKPFEWRLGKAFLFGELGAPSLLGEKSGMSLGEQELPRWIFTSFTPPGKHILISFRCSVLSFNSSTCQLNLRTVPGLLRCGVMKGKGDHKGLARSSFLLSNSVEMPLLQCPVDTPEVWQVCHGS